MNKNFEKEILFEIFEYFLSWNCLMENQILNLQPPQPLENFSLNSASNGLYLDPEQSGNTNLVKGIQSKILNTQIQNKENQNNQKMLN